MSIQKHLTDSYSLLDTTKAMRDWKAIGALIGTGVIAALVFAVFQALAMQSFNMYVMATGSFLAFAVGFYGVNAVGIMNLKAVEGIQLTYFQAFAISLGVSHRLILIGLLAGLFCLVGLFAIGVLLFICKMPGIGPILLTGVMPIGSLAIGLGALFLGYIFYPLAGPAIWSGEKTMRAFTILLAIARANIVSIVIKMVLLTLLVGFVGGIVFGVIGTGTLIMSGLTASFVSIGSPFSHGFSVDQLMWSIMGGGSGHMTGAMIGNGLLVLAASSAVFMIFLRGLCTIYLDAREECDPELLTKNFVPESLQKKVNDVREAIAQTQQQALSVRKCKRCGSVLNADDRFCGECGEPQ